MNYEFLSSQQKETVLQRYGSSRNTQIWNEALVRVKRIFEECTTVDIRYVVILQKGRYRYSMIVFDDGEYYPIPVRCRNDRQFTEIIVFSTLWNCFVNESGTYYRIVRKKEKELIKRLVRLTRYRNIKDEARESLMSRIREMQANENL